MSSQVNVHSEWGPLREVVVGSVFNVSSHNVDLSFKVFFHDNVKDVLLQKSITLQTKLIEERQADLDQLAHVLTNLGIKVMRPQELSQVKKFTTPHFEDHTSPSDNPRDQVLILGNRIIETPSIWRKRFFENDLLKKIFYPYFHAGSPWISAPRPTMRDESYDLSYSKNNLNISDELHSNQNPSEFEIMFDAAQCLKFGKDIVMNVSNENHRMGMKWLQGVIGDVYRIHPVHLTDHHIDSMFMPIAPGKMLVNTGSMKSKMSLLPKALQSWEMIPVEIESVGDYKLNLASRDIYTNVLPIGPNKIIIFNESETPDKSFTSVLDRHKVEYIHVRLRHARLFGGGAHCVTLDLVRDEKLEDYFT